MRVWIGLPEHVSDANLISDANLRGRCRQGRHEGESEKIGECCDEGRDQKRVGRGKPLQRYVGDGHRLLCSIFAVQLGDRAAHQKVHEPVETRWSEQAVGIGQTARGHGHHACNDRECEGLVAAWNSIAHRGPERSGRSVEPASQHACPPCDPAAATADAKRKAHGCIREQTECDDGLTAGRV